MTRPRMARTAFVALATTVVVGVVAPAANAYNGDEIGAASSGITGTTVKNKNSHIWTTIIGTYKYNRVLKGHPVPFRGITISMQQCDADHCWGPVEEGNLWSPHQLGQPVSSKDGGHPAGATDNICLSTPAAPCGAPWHWINSAVAEREQQIQDNLIKPCTNGALAGFGVKVAEKTAGQIAAESGLLATGERAAGILGPEGYAVGTMAGCFVGVGVKGYSDIKKIASALNPFDKSGPRRHERRVSNHQR